MKKKIGLYVQERLPSGERGIQDPTPTLGLLLGCRRRAGEGFWELGGILAKLFPVQPHRAVQQPSYGGMEAGLEQANKQNWEPVPCAVLPSKSVCEHHPSQSCTNPRMMQHSSQSTANPWFEPSQ